MDKQTLKAALAKMPADASKIRVARLWRKDIGDFAYVSFESALHVNRFYWDMAVQQRARGGKTLWIKRIPLQEGGNDATKHEA